MNHPAALPTRLVDALPSPSMWKAGLQLRVGLSSASGEPKSVIQHLQHKGPLYVQKAFYPEGPGLAHIYPLHPPGGLVSGDALRLEVDVQPGARTLMTTPGAARVYRARPDRTLQEQHQVFTLREGASLEWLPLETIVYPDAQASLSTHVRLSNNARLVLWEVCALGLPVSGMPFDCGSLMQTLQIEREGRIVLRERLRLDPRSPHSTHHTRVGYQGQSVCGLMVMGPFDTEVSEPLREQLRSLCAASPLSSITEVGSFLIARHLGSCTELSKKLFTALWQATRPALIGRPACAPRVWRT